MPSGLVLRMLPDSEAYFPCIIFIFLCIEEDVVHIGNIFCCLFLCTTYICNIITYKYMFGSILQVVWVCFAGLWQTSQERGISLDMLQGKVHAEE